jgi:hypothetical protein
MGQRSHCAGRLRSSSAWTWPTFSLIWRRYPHSIAGMDRFAIVGSITTRAYRGAIVDVVQNRLT